MDHILTKEQLDRIFAAVDAYHNQVPDIKQARNRHNKFGLLTREEVAVASGISSTTFQRAIYIVEHGTPVLLAAVKEARTSIQHAEQVARYLSPDKIDIVCAQNLWPILYAMWRNRHNVPVAAALDAWLLAATQKIAAAAATAEAAVPEVTAAAVPEVTAAAASTNEDASTTVPAGSLSGQVAALEKAYKDMEAAWVAAEETAEAAKEKEAAVTAQLEQERLVSATLRQAQSAEPKMPAEVTEAIVHTYGKDAFQAICQYALEGIQTPEECLFTLEIGFGERVVVLPSAYASAKNAANFKYGKQLGALLYRFVTDYYVALARGDGEALTHNILGQAYCPGHGDESKAGAKARQARTFTHRGVVYVMWRHLRIGTRENTAETIRVHFAWDSTNKKLVIGHCGEHLVCRGEQH